MLCMVKQWKILKIKINVNIVFFVKLLKYYFDFCFSHKSFFFQTIEIRLLFSLYKMTESKNSPGNKTLKISTWGIIKI